MHRQRRVAEVDCLAKMSNRVHDVARTTHVLGQASTIIRLPARKRYGARARAMPA